MTDDGEDDTDYKALWRNKAPNATDFHVARGGDHMICPFLCETCVFRTVRHESPNKNKITDAALLQDIRRANLDAFWSRSTSTVMNNTRLVKRVIEDANSRGMSGPY